MSFLALKEGWSAPQLNLILSGNFDRPQEELDRTASSVARLRLIILEQQKRYAEYENLARYEKLTLQLVHILIVQGKVDQALQISQIQVLTNVDALAIAKEFYDAQYIQQAILIASHGLTLEGWYKNDLCEWLGAVAEEQEDYSLAQKVHILAFETKILLSHYHQALKVTPPNETGSMKDQLLNFIRNKKSTYVCEDAVDIFLHEGLLTDAMNEVSKPVVFAYSDGAALKKVMIAVMSSQMDWIAEQGLKQALAVINSGKANHYGQAIDWLQLVKEAYEKHDKLTDWYVCLNQIRIGHKTKRKLMEMLTKSFGVGTTYK